MIKYAKDIGANQEVIDWCSRILGAFKKKAVTINIGEFEHILDYLVSDKAPARLRKMSYAQALSSANKWSAASQKKGSKIIDSPEDLKTLHEFTDGCRIVELLTKSAYEREGFFMAHCVGGYSPDTSTVYSYRDSDNKPHATFEVTKDGGEISQIKGKGNGNVHPKYIEPILIFLKIIGKEIRPSEMSYLGYHHITPAVEITLDKFVDPRGDKVKFVTLYGNKYLFESRSC